MHRFKAKLRNNAFEKFMKFSKKKKKFLIVINFPFFILIGNETFSQCLLTGSTYWTN